MDIKERAPVHFSAWTVSPKNSAGSGPLALFNLKKGLPVTPQITCKAFFSGPLRSIRWSSSLSLTEPPSVTSRSPLPPVSASRLGGARYALNVNNASFMGNYSFNSPYGSLYLLRTNHSGAVKPTVLQMKR